MPPLTLVPATPAVPVTATDLRKLPPDAQRLARLAALDAFLQHVCPRAPTEDEVVATATRLLAPTPQLDGSDALAA